MRNSRLFATADLETAMNRTKTGYDVSAITHTFLGVPESVRLLLLQHVVAFLLFAALSRMRTTYLPLSVPAILLAGYQEWAIYIRDGTSTMRYSIIGLLIPWMTTFAYRFVTRRVLMHNLPGPAHNLLLGSLPTMAKEAPKFPPDFHSQLLMNHIAEEYDLRKYGLFYVDVYPIQSYPLLVVTSPEVAAQVTQITSYPKHPALNTNFGRALGVKGILGQEGEAWRELRTMFNPGFSQANLFSMVPMIAEESEIFVSRLSKLAAGDGFVPALESLAADLTVDVIGQALLGMKFNSQTRTNDLVSSIMEASRLTRTSSNFSLARVDLWRILKLRYYEKLSNSMLTQMLRQKWSDLAASPKKAAHSNAIFDIAMMKYMKNKGQLDGNLTNDFIGLMRDNVKTFIFAGHDTTSSVIAYAFYELSRNSKILKEVRREHEVVLGPDSREAVKQLKNNPKLANALPLTTAVIREILRLYLPASSIREGSKGATLIGKDGKSYPAEGCMVWVSNNIGHHDSECFPRPYDFNPYRFLPSSPFPPIPKNAFRPFEKGPRDCIGQELAMLESRIVLAVVLRQFEFREAYVELDRRLGRKPKGYEACDKIGGRAYQILWTTAKPKDGLPMWVQKLNELGS
ncbi:hypothetical protein ACHAP3_008861 [Botrytis cinerea]